MGFSISKENIIAKMEAVDKTSAIDQLIGHVAKNIQFDTAAILKMIYQREIKRNSGFGKSVAFIHVLSPLINDPVIALATLKEPLEWNSLDAKPVKVIGLVLENPKFIKEYFSTVAAYAKLLSIDNVRYSLTSMITVDQILTVLKVNQVG